jgi:Flp pilus assembly pilin Flp
MPYSPQEVEPGQSIVETALIIVLVSIVVILALTGVAPSIGDIYSNIVNAL